MIKPGDLLLEKGDGPVRNIIKKKTESEYSHIAVALDEHYMIEAHATGVRICSIANNMTCDFDVYRYELRNFKREELAEAAIEYEGRMYDYGQLLWMGIKSNLLGEVKLNSTHFLICSELAILMYRYMGVYMLNNMYIGDVTPADCVKPSIMRLKESYKGGSYEPRFTTDI